MSIHRDIISEYLIHIKTPDKLYVFDGHIDVKIKTRKFIFWLEKHGMDTFFAHQSTTVIYPLTTSRAYIHLTDPTDQTVKIHYLNG